MGNAIYTGTATIGRVESTVGAIVMTVIGAAVVIGGLYAQSESNKESAHVQGTVTGDSVAQTDTDSQGGTYTTYTAPVEWMPAGTKTKRTCSFTGTFSNPVSQGDKVTVYYNPAIKHKCDPDARVVAATWQRYLGSIVAGIALLVVIFTWVWTVLGYEYKPIAALQGAGAIKNVLF